MRSLIALLIAVAALAAVFITKATGGSSAESSPPPTGSSPPPSQPDPAQPEPATPDPSTVTPVALRSFGTCRQLLDYTKQHAIRAVGPWGLPWTQGFGGPFPVGAVIEEEAMATEAPREAQPDVDYSTTNIQEVGVDEPDIVKSDGSHLFTIAQGKLHAVDVSGTVPRLLDSLLLEQGWNHQLLLRGDRVLVLANGEGIAKPQPLLSEESILPYLSATVLVEVDVSDPAFMRIVRTLTVEGNFVSARLTESTARVVVSASPALPFVQPTGYELLEEAQATIRNRAVIASSGLSDWLPTYTLEDHRTGWTQESYLTDCGDVHHPAEFSGLGTLTVLTIDLERGLEPIDSDAIMTGGETVYASSESLYVATQQWLDPAARPEVRIVPSELTTALHKFDISDPAETVYRASGEVFGHLLNQWSMSEHEGFFRVATTTTPMWLGDVELESQSLVTVLEEQAGELVEIGRVGGLGRGERIFGVRFMGDVGYVVTFRQIDPLYTVDLSDPRRPKVLGELKIPGYSAYLHPVDKETLIGLGQDATLDGGILGTQLSLFDVSDLRDPRRLHKQSLEGGFSEAEYDHHAFLYWPASKLAVVPVQAPYGDASGTGQGFFGAVAFRIDRQTGIELLGTIDHGNAALGTYPEPEIAWYAPIRRALVVGDALYTVSEQGVKASSLATLADRAFIPFA